jgi:hypothetical protein
MADQEDLPPTPRRVIVAFDIGIKNLAVCILSVGPKEDPAAEVIIWKVISLAEQKEKIPGIHEVAGRLFMALDELVAELETASPGVRIDSVIIENQPSRLNGGMKTIQVMVYSYFQLRRHWEGFVDSTLMVSASQKLQCHTHEITAAPAGKTGYALNKWKAIQYGMQYIKDCPKLSQFVNKHKKKDDLFDSGLHAVSWLKRQGYLIETLRAADSF